MAKKIFSKKINSRMVNECPIRFIRLWNGKRYCNRSLANYAFNREEAWKETSTLEIAYIRVD
jgi:hypothetical protein